jgi:hypothetical protein
MSSSLALVVVRVVLVSALSLASLGCDPSAFTRAARDNAHAGAGGRAAAAGRRAVAGRFGSGGVVQAGNGGAAIGGIDAGAAGDDGDDAAMSTARDAGAPAHAGHGGARAPAAGSGGAGSGGVGGSSGTGGADGACEPRESLDGLEITHSELGALVVPSALDEVAAGPSVLVQDRMLWLLATRQQGPFEGRPIAVTVAPANLKKTPPQLDDGSVAQLLQPAPSTVDGTSVSATTAWLAADGGSAAYFFSRYYIFASLGVGLAQTTTSGANATIVTDMTQLFPPVPAADGGMTDGFRPTGFASTLLRAGVLYVYACQVKPGTDEGDVNSAHYQPCRVGRVPAPLAADGTRYQFWDGKQWQADFMQASVQLDHVASGLSVEYNAYLGKFLAVNSDADNTLTLKWSEAPEGPFVSLAKIDTVKGTGGGLPFSYSAREHIGLRQDCDRTLYISYAVPIIDASDATVVHQETHVVRVELK